jgi:hypothetical protein
MVALPHLSITTAAAAPNSDSIAVIGLMSSAAGLG